MTEALALVNMRRIEGGEEVRFVCMALTDFVDTKEAEDMLAA